MSLLAVDIGSSRCKAVAFSLTGKILAQHTCAYEPEFPAPSHAEINPESFWQAVCRSVQSAANNLSDPVRALCLNSHGETFVPVNEHNQAIAPAILNQDNRVCGRSGLAGSNNRKKNAFRNYRPGRSSHVPGAKNSLAAKAPAGYFYSVGSFPYRDWVRACSLGTTSLRRLFLGFPLSGL